MPTPTSTRLSDDARHLLDNALTAIAALEAVRDETGQIVDFRYLVVNQMVERLSGRPASQIEGGRLLELFPGTRASGLFERWVRVVETGEPMRFQEHYCENDTDVWYDTQAVRRGDGLIESFSDITPLKVAEQAQQQQTTLLQELIDTLPSMLTISQAVRDEAGKVIDFRIVGANQPAITAFGRPVEQIVGQLAADVFPNDRLNGVYDAYVRVVETGVAEQMELSVPTPNGTRWLDARLMPLSADRVTASVLDITKLKEAQLLNQQQADTLREVMNATPTAIVVHEAIRNEGGLIVDFRMTLVNQLAAQWMQDSPDALRNKRLTEQFPGILKSPIFAAYTQVVEAGQPARYERCIGGTWYDFSVVKSGDGCIVAAIDVTKTRQQRQQLEVANAELVRSNDNLAQFAYVASHDLQEPLRKIQSFGDVLTKQFGQQLSTEGQDLLHRMQAAANRMSLLIKDLLDYSRISTQREPFHQVVLDDVLHETLDDLDLLIQETKAVIAAAPLPILLGDQRQLKQVFQNLLANALKFRKPGHAPQISIDTQRLKRSKAPADLLLTTPADELHIITIADDGIGFDPRHAERIFQVFQRLHGRSQYPGTGVGLAICRKVAENHGGAITVASEPNVGSTFTLYLPA